MNTRLARITLLLVAIAALAITPFAGAQEGSAITVDLAPYEDNPILVPGDYGEWDDGTVWAPVVMLQDGLYHMFYSGARLGFGGATFAIGYATSPDGLVWEKSAENPIFEADDTGFDAAAVGIGAALVEEGTWMLYYLGEERFGSPYGSGIGRATAPDPTGSWTREEEPVLLPGSQGEWDYPGVVPASVLTTDNGYVMYYFGGNFISEMGNMLGMATSPDGIHWTKYDDPATTEPPFAESDPVLQPGLEGWTTVTLYGGSVRLTAEGWEMFYSEKGRSESEPLFRYRLGYANSDDGIHWTKSMDFPILSAEDDPATPLLGYLSWPSVVEDDSTTFLYYDYHWSSGVGIAVATGTITRE